MLTDLDCATVYVSDLLEGRHLGLSNGLRAVLSKHCVRLRTVVGTRDIWCRDYMPVQVDLGNFVRFRYDPGYLKGYEHLLTRPCDITPINGLGQCVDSDIVLDGGNVVGWGSRCIVTDRLFRENPRVCRDELLGRLRELLEVDEVIVIPKEPYDEVGHADGVVRFLDDRLVVINDYSQVASWYRRRLTSVLRRAGLDWVELPYRPEDEIVNGIPSAVGCYTNFLMVRGLAVVPAFGLTEDQAALRVIEENIRDTAVVLLECTDLARGGGVLNCATWTVAGQNS
jgi:agmatine deiminase